MEGDTVTVPTAPASPQGFAPPGPLPTPLTHLGDWKAVPGSATGRDGGSIAGRTSQERRARLGFTGLEGMAESAML